MRAKVQIILMVLSITTLFTSCDDSRYFEQTKEVADKTWDINDEFSFEFDIQDTVNTYDFLLNLRNEADYPYANIWLFIDYKYPNDKSITDTIEFPLAYPDGRWIGKGIGDIIDNQIYFKQKIRFPMTGEYQISFRHGMRANEVPHITDVGFRIQYSR